MIIEYFVSRYYDRKKDRSEEDQRIPLYLPVSPPPKPRHVPYEKGEGIEIKIISDDEKEDGVIIIDM